MVWYSERGRHVRIVEGFQRFVERAQPIGLSGNSGSDTDIRTRRRGIKNMPLSSSSNTPRANPLRISGAVPRAQLNELPQRPVVLTSTSRTSGTSPRKLYTPDCRRAVPGPYG